MGCNVEIRLVSIQFTSFWDVSMWQTVVFFMILHWQERCCLHTLVRFLFATYHPALPEPNQVRQEMRSVWDVEKTLHSEMSTRHGVSQRRSHGSYSNAGGSPQLTNYYLGFANLRCLEKVPNIFSPNRGERWWWIPWYKATKTSNWTNASYSYRFHLWHLLCGIM